MRALVLIALLGCSDVVQDATIGESPEELIERTCLEHGWTCARVYAFAEPADNPLGRVEMCVREQDLPLAESMFGAYELSPDERFAKWALLGVPPVCIWCEGFGCNSYSGCFNCPEAP